MQPKGFFLPPDRRVITEPFSASGRRAETRLQGPCCHVDAPLSFSVISVHDERLEYQLSQRLENPGVQVPPRDIPPLAFSPDGQFLARYFDPRRICCFFFPDFEYRAKICLPRRGGGRTGGGGGGPLSNGVIDERRKDVGAGKRVITAYAFASSGNGVLVVCSSDSMMRIYDLSEAVSRVNCTTRGSWTALKTLWLPGGVRLVR